MRSSSSSARLVSVVGLAAALLPCVWCASCSLTTSLDGLSGGAFPDGAAGTPGSEGGASADGQAASDARVTTDGSAGEASTSSAYRAAVLADGPIGYWRLGESAGASLAKDESGHGRDGVYAGGITFGSPGALAGDGDTATHFDGVTSSVALGTVFLFDGVTSFTAEAWIRPERPAGYGGIVTRSLDPDGWALYVDSTLAVSLERQKSGADDVVAGPTAPSTSFSHVVATYDGSLLRLFFDGKLVGGPTPSGSIKGAATGAFLGTDGDDDRYKGDIDEVALYDHALSDTQVLAHYKVGKGL